MCRAINVIINALDDLLNDPPTAADLPLEDYQCERNEKLDKVRYIIEQSIAHFKQ